ncbi:MAG TPA: chitobiase/beta-hexosaminidase C-terminal domain-containing protein, partial [Bacteroidia bacterium]|nr:chitobiase/beta-hexosaminidase C-terminal domain-containing protein [Bacteroidia bacterium]
MKNLFTLFLVVVFMSTIFSQQNYDCILKSIPVDVYTKVSPPSIFRDRLSLGKVATGNITIEYHNNVPETAKPALEYAVNIWNHILKFSAPVKIFFHWLSMPPTPEGSIPLGGNLPMSPIYIDGIFYPPALANIKSGYDHNGTNSEIYIAFNSNMDWYYGTDQQVPTGKKDLVSVALHEIAHGLGWQKSFDMNEFGEGWWGKYVDEVPYPMIFDTFVDNFVFQLIDQDKFINHSFDLGAELTSEHIFFSGSEAKAVYNGNKPPLFSPVSWLKGSSISHLDEATFPNEDINSLMTPGLSGNESIHSPGPILIASLCDMGWSINRVIEISEPLVDVQWGLGGTYKIKWTDTQTGNIKISLAYTDGTSTVHTIVDPIVSSKGNNEYRWYMWQTIPNGEYKIKISDNSGNVSLSEKFYISGYVQSQVATPVITPNGGRFDQSVNVTVNCGTDGAQIKYTTDGSDPLNSATAIVYTGSFNLDNTTTIKARGFKSGWQTSGMKTATFQIGPAPVSINVYNVYYPYQYATGDVLIWKDNAWENNHNAIKQIQSDEAIILQYSLGYEGGKNKFHRAETSGTQKTNLNYSQFLPYNQTNDWWYKGYFDPVSDATINTIYEGNPSITGVGDSVAFLDPWYYDLEHPLLGKRNRGSFAIFHNNKIPFTPNTNTTGDGSEYKGVLLHKI